jgi:hypothetical protein
MVAKRAETIIDRPADVVWARVRDFGDLSWVPRNEGCSLEGDIRTITVKGADFKAYQQLLELDDEKRLQRYRTAEAPEGAAKGPIPQLEGTLVVTPHGESSSLVTWDVDTTEQSVDYIRGEYQTGLDNLKAILEA